MKDYLTAIDEVSKEPFVDRDHRGCVGASFGGFSVYWLAGHHEGRFKAFIAHDGIFNMEMQYLETEEKWFANWDMGGAYWDLENETAQRTFANSPHRFVDKWDTPILCIHGEKDYRILANQAMAAFDAAQLRGIPPLGAPPAERRALATDVLRLAGQVAEARPIIRRHKQLPHPCPQAG